MKIGFSDPELEEVFNDYGSLQDSYGDPLADKIAVRMAVLAAAPHLGVVPHRPPIRLRPVDTRTGQFTVDLILPHRLRFSALPRGIRVRRDVPRESIDEVEILAVD